MITIEKLQEVLDTKIPSEISFEPGDLLTRIIYDQDLDSTVEITIKLIELEPNPYVDRNKCKWVLYSIQK